jgi:hypothetical protein
VTDLKVAEPRASGGPAPPAPPALIEAADQIDDLTLIYRVRLHSFQEMDSSL